MWFDLILHQTRTSVLTTNLNDLFGSFREHHVIVRLACAILASTCEAQTLNYMAHALVEGSNA